MSLVLEVLKLTLSIQEVLLQGKKQFNKLESIRTRRKVESYFFFGVCLRWEAFLLQNLQHNHLDMTKP
jgi:hypothetical protein